ncbi:MAG: sigma-54-dependent Fis family transcriptional regulator [bacterium]|nr:sigma-54-dependent Fis family transcriptional regulator [bacterium]
MLHEHSLRCKEPLVKVNCASFSASMAEAELFGVAKGAATGVRERAGRFEAANGGTLFLDEIADMPLDLQAKILRVVEYQHFERVGSVRSIGIDVRFIFATHQNIEQLVRQGRFRDDLYHRISTVTIEIPPLRERRGDIQLLTEHFLKSFSTKANPPRFESAVLDFFIQHAWPGNVRQLRSVIEFCCLMYPGELIGLDHLPSRLTQSVESDPTENPAGNQERELILRAMQATRGNKTKAALLLGLNLSSLRRRLAKYHIR